MENINAVSREEWMNFRKDFVFNPFSQFPNQLRWLLAC